MTTEQTKATPQPEPWNTMQHLTAVSGLASVEITRLREVNADLLAALQGLLEYHRRDDYVGMAKRYQDTAEAAILKAEGGAS